MENFEESLELFETFLTSIITDPVLLNPAVVHLSVAFKGCFVKDATHLPAAVDNYCPSRASINLEHTALVGPGSRTACSNSCRVDSCCSVREHVIQICSRTGVPVVDFKRAIDAFCTHEACLDTFGNNMAAIMSFFDGYGNEKHAWFTGHRLLGKMLVHSIELAELLCPTDVCHSSVPAASSNSSRFQCLLTLTHGHGSELEVLSNQSYELSSDNKHEHDSGRNDAKTAFVVQLAGKSTAKDVHGAFMELKLPSDLASSRSTICLLLWGCYGDSIDASCGGKQNATYAAGSPNTWGIDRRIFTVVCNAIQCTRSTLRVQPATTGPGSAAVCTHGAGIAGLMVADAQ